MTGNSHIKDHLGCKRLEEIVHYVVKELFTYPPVTFRTQLLCLSNDHIVSKAHSSLNNFLPERLILVSSEF